MAFLEIDRYLPNQEVSPSSTSRLYDGIGSDKFENALSGESTDLNILEGLYLLRSGFILNEKWENSYLLSGRINSISEDFVSCEIIIDKDNKETQIRKYPIKQLQHLPSISIGKTIKIKINEKPGSFRLDIIDGTNTGIEKEFENMSNWDELENFEMDNPADLNA